MSIKNKIRLLGIVLSSSTILLGCNAPDPAIKSAQQFGMVAADFSSKTDKLSNDIYDSCLRRTSYFTVRQGTTQRDKALDNCEKLNKPTAVRTKSATGLITSYITSIGSLASDNPAKFDDDFNSLKNALNGLSVPNSGISISSNTVDKGIQIANLVFGWVVNQRRKGSLREAVVCTDQPLQEYNMGLNDAFRKGYIEGILEDERKTALSYYNFYLARLQKNGSERDFLELEKSSSQAIQQLVVRRDSAESYIAIIDRTTKMHMELKQVFLENTKPPSEAACNTYLKAKDSSSTKALSEKQSDYSNAPLTVKEVARIRGIVLDYQKEIAPLLKKMK
jgi:hypothetical protein